MTDQPDCSYDKTTEPVDQENSRYHSHQLKKGFQHCLLQHSCVSDDDVVV